MKNNHTEHDTEIDGRQPVTARARDKRDQIVRASYEICLDKGFAHITVSDIAERVGMTRSLFYHYFRNKEDVADAVLDEAVNIIIGRLEQWNKRRKPGDVNKALDDLVSLMRTIINEDGPFREKMLQSGSGQLYINFVQRVSERTIDFIREATIKDFQRIHIDLPTNNIREIFIVTIGGSIALLRDHKEVSDETMKDIIAQALHLKDHLQFS